MKATDQSKSDTQAAQFEQYRPVNVPGRPEQALYLPTFPVAPDNPRAADWSRWFDMAQDNTFYQSSLRADIEFGGFATLTSLSSYSHYHPHSPSDTDGTDFDDFEITLWDNVSSWCRRRSGNVYRERQAVGL